MTEHSLYNPLKDREFRLLRLRCSFENSGKPIHSGQYGSVACDIKTFSLDDCPAYTALSYTWGLEDASMFNLQDVEQPILLNGRTKLVQQNLAQFLSQVRPDSSLLRRQGDSESDDEDPPDHLSREVGYIWIDALCINQDSIPERNAQVALMREIYAYASRIIIWLGPGNADSDLALDVYKRLGSKPPMTVTFSMLPEQEQAALRNLSTRPWWGRVWIWQEATTPHVYRELWCGDRRIPFETMLYANNSQHGDWSTEAVPSADGSSTVLPEVFTNLSLFHMARLQVSREVGMSVSMADINFLAFARSLKCKDDRDKIFAVLPMFAEIYPNEEPPPLPNYNLSAKDVFYQAMAYILQTNWGFETLLLCKMNPRTDTPGWVPAFSASPRPVYIYEEAFHYRAAGDTKPAISFANDSKHLVVMGSVVDFVTEVHDPSVSAQVEAKPWEEKQKLYGPLFVAWVKSLAKFIFADAIDGPYIDGSSISDAIHRCLVQEVPSTSHPQPKLDLVGISAGHVEPPELSFHRDPTFSIWRRSRDVMIFWTSQGYIGSADGPVEAGDAVAVLDGLNVPVIMRPSLKGPWKVVAPCYVSGIMNGELQDRVAEHFEIC